MFASTRLHHTLCLLLLATLAGTAPGCSDDDTPVRTVEYRTRNNGNGGADLERTGSHSTEQQRARTRQGVLPPPDDPGLPQQQRTGTDHEQRPGRGARAGGRAGRHRKHRPADLETAARRRQRRRHGDRLPGDTRQLRRPQPVDVSLHGNEPEVASTGSRDSRSTRTSSAWRPSTAPGTATRCGSA